ncbi:polyprenyl synthetase family protein [Streptomyces canus]|uniref:polyprenyl synthetase family protein n=1 Tax=Streptomyces canus TaxID=58343 RepID=UPI0037F6322A
MTDLLGPNPRDRDQALLDSLLAGSAAVEEGLLRAAKSDVRSIAESGRRLLRAGNGLRLRPVLVLLAAQFGDPHAPGVVPAAVVLELTHLAALAHDSVRGAGAAGHTKTDPGALPETSIALLAGDFLFARASQLLADLGPDAVREQTAAYERLVTGQILSRTGPGEDCDPVAHNREVAAARTGSLTGVAGRLGALAAGTADFVGDALTRYGERLGTALGLTDDVPGPDIEHPFGVEVSTEPRPPRTHPAPGRAMRDALCKARQARAALQDLPDCAARDALAALCDAAASRARR